MALGEDSQYFEDGITKFKMNQSIFDLAVIRFLLSISFIALYTEIESTCMQIISNGSQGRRSKLRKKKTLFMAMTFLFAAGSLAYSIVKFIFINSEYKKDSMDIHSTCYALAISSVAFSGLQFLLFFINIYMERKLMIRYSRMIDSEGESSDDQKKSKSKADLGRLFSLAKPVSSFFSVSNFLILMPWLVSIIAFKITWQHYYKGY